MARTLIISDRHNSFFTANNIRVGNRIPTEGNYVKGDIIVNTGNTTSEAMWICVESGNPGIWEVVGAGAGGGSNFVSINNTVFVNEPVNEVELGLGVTITSKDKLIVHHNSIHLMQDVDYRIEGNKIVKLTEGNWNEDSEEAMFAFELFKNVESVDGNLVEIKSKLVCMQNTVTVNGAVNEVKIGIEGFNKDKDTLMVFENETFLTRGVNYEINENGDGIVPVGDEVWNDVMIDDWSYTFVVFKDVPLVEGEDKIGMDLLADDVKKAIQDASNIDLSGYATKEEMNGKVAQGDYDTKIAELEEKVNEAFTSANNGKQLIASAIGEPVSADDTFSAMSDKINDMKSDLKQVLTDEGVSVSEEDDMNSLIAKVDEEFDRQENELNTQITLLNNQINSLTSELAGKVNPAGTAVAGDVLSGKTFINSTGNTITGGMANQGSKTFTPSASKQTGAAGYYSGITVNAVSNLSAANIKNGVVVGGVTGTAPIPSGTATASQVLTGYTFSNGSSVGITGTMANQGAKTFTPSASKQTGAAGYYSGITVNTDSNLVAANIVSGKTIFGVTGTAKLSPLPTWYNASNKWTLAGTTGDAIPASYEPASLIYINGYLYYVEITDSNNSGMSHIGRYNCSNNTYSILNTTNGSQRAAAANNGNQIYLFGGASRGWTLYDTTLCYDVSTNTWTNKATLPAKLCFSAAENVGGKIYVSGGSNSSSSNSVNTNYCYDPSTNTWTTKTAMSIKRSKHLTGVYNNQIIVAGGNTGMGEITTNVAWYNPSTNTWTNKSTAAPNSFNNMSSCMCNNYMYVGASGYHWRYTPSSDTWTTRTTLTSSNITFGSDGKFVYAFNNVVHFYIP